MKQLTRQQLVVARMMAECKQNHQIAEALVINMTTVKSHVQKVYKKLGFNATGSTRQKRQQVAHHLQSLGVV